MHKWEYQTGRLNNDHFKRKEDGRSKKYVTVTHFYVGILLSDSLFLDIMFFLCSESGQIYNSSYKLNFRSFKKIRVIFMDKSFFLNIKFSTLILSEKV